MAIETYSRRMLIVGCLLSGWLLSGWLLGGCGDEPGAGDNDAALPDAALDAAVTPDAAPDADVTPDPPCVTPLVTGQIFELDPDGPDTQIHVNAAFDGESVWVVYNRPDALGGFDVYGLRLDCDGTQRLPPFQINTSDWNDLDPALSVGSGKVYVAWQTDTSVWPNNMDTVFRTYDVSGTALMATDLVLETQREGNPVPGNAWMPDVAALPGGGFVLAGARGIDDASGFQVYLQWLSDTGVAQGESVDASYMRLASQTYPAVAAATDGTVYLAFTHDASPYSDEHVLHAAYATSGSSPIPNPPALAAEGRAGTAPAYAAAPDGRVYLAFTDPDTNQVVLTDGKVFGTGPIAELGTPGRMDYGATLATTTGGGAVAWFRNVSGFSNNLRVQSFTFDGSTFQLGTATTASTETVPPYAPAITHITGDIYFVAWSQGANPDYRVVGTFIELQ